jgi:carboxypeptidase family protein
MHTMRRGLLALIAVVGATACGGGATGLVSLPPCASSATTGVIGCVTNSRGGPAVSGARITASGTTTTATTNTQGAYALSLSPATYDILASKPGMAASKFQGVIVQAGQATTANLIMFNVFDPTMVVAAPTITVSGLSQGQTVTGTISFTVNVTASNSVRRIDVRTSNMNALPQASIADSSTATLTLNSTLLADGAAFVDIIAYDLNNNAAELVVGFTVNNASSGAPPGMPSNLSLVAVTTGQSLALFRTQRASTFSTLGVPQDPTVLSVNGHSVSLLAAPPNSTLFVNVTWIAVSSAVGYKVYRSFSAAGPFVQVAQFSWSLPALTNPSYSDADPSLTPGVPVYYRVSSFNAGGESAPTAAASVTPLPAFNLNLTTPPNNATGTSSTPTFTWTPTVLIGTDQFYDISVIGLNDAFPSWITTAGSLHNVTSAVYGTVGVPSVNPLQSGKVYQWDIYQAQAQIIYDPFSAAIAPANGRAGGSLNGPFKFTTLQ